MSDAARSWTPNAMMTAPDDGTTRPAQGLGAAWRRLRAREPEEAQDSGRFWTTGVTYRGYMGVKGGVASSWMTEQHLRETQALLRMAAAAGRLGAWAVELPSRRWIWSDEVKAIHEVPADYEPHHAAVMRFYAPDSQARLAEALEVCAGRGVPFDLELELLTAAGQTVWIRAIGDAETNAEGVITHVRGALQDVSQQRAAAEEARVAAERLTRTLESLPDGYMLLDREFRFVYLNAGAERILKRRRGDLLRRSLLTEFPETAAGSFLDKCRTALREDSSVEFEKYYPPLQRWIYMKVMPSDLGLTLCIRDDTERITARRELLQLKAQLAALKP